MHVHTDTGKPSVSFTRPNNTTAYDIGDVCSATPTANLEFTNVMSAAGSDFLITGLSMRAEVSSIPTGMSGFRLHLFDSAPTPIADGATFNIITADKEKYLGNILIDPLEDLGDELYVRMNNINFQDKLAFNSTSLFGVLETRGAYTPTAQAVKVIKLRVVGV